MKVSEEEPLLAAEGLMDEGEKKNVAVDGKRRGVSSLYKGFILVLICAETFGSPCSSPWNKRSGDSQGK